MGKIGCAYKELHDMWPRCSNTILTVLVIDQMIDSSEMGPSSLLQSDSNNFLAILQAQNYFTDYIPSKSTTKYHFYWAPDSSGSGFTQQAFCRIDSNKSEVYLQSTDELKCLCNEFHPDVFSPRPQCRDNIKWVGNFFYRSSLSGFFREEFSFE